ncbi:MAG TPA: hypothetical protein VH372_11680 [Actinospica sp.]|jgi:hypothetical protein|nr:hypothetical protein [Actinospica sp.]
MATLTAPIRWLGHTVRSLTGFTHALPMPRLGFATMASKSRPIRSWRKPPWPDEEGRGGVREPRRPRRTPPTGAMALPEPTGQERTDLSH